MVSGKVNMSLLCQTIFSGYMAECDKKLLSFSTNHILQHNTPQWLSNLAEGDIQWEFAFSNLPRVISKLWWAKYLKCLPELLIRVSLFIFSSTVFSLETSNYIVRSLQRSQNRIDLSVKRRVISLVPTHMIFIYWVKYPFKGKYCVCTSTHFR